MSSARNDLDHLASCDDHSIEKEANKAGHFGKYYCLYKKKKIRYLRQKICSVLAPIKFDKFVNGIFFYLCVNND